MISAPSPTIGNFWFDRRAGEFSPDVLVTDSRRSFPLAVRLKGVTGARVFTFFLDHLEKTDRKGRDGDGHVRCRRALRLVPAGDRVVVPGADPGPTTTPTGSFAINGLARWPASLRWRALLGLEK